MRLSERKATIAGSFGRRAATYETAARLQEEVAGTLAEMLPPLTRPRVLEIGAGTGFLTGRLFERYPDGDFLITDISPDMLAFCRKKFGGDRAAYALMDGERPQVDQTYDLIASSMTAQWFDDPPAALERLRGCLKPGGALHYSCLGEASFREWNDSLRVADVASGALSTGALPGICGEQYITVRYASALAFLGSLKALGAGTPREGYRPAGPSLRQACRIFDKTYDGRVTWHVVFGRLEGKSDA